jgi:radical SAM superfamily enzyme YgiQ (UPF0313 family)
MPVMPAGACVVAEAAERAGHRVRLLDLMFEHDPVSALEAEFGRACPDVVGLSVRNIDNNDMGRPEFFVKHLRPLMDVVRARSGARVVLGGAAAGVMPHELLRYTGADCAVTSDGEAVFPELLENLSDYLKASETPGTAWIMDGHFISTPPRPGGLAGGCLCPDYHRWIDVGRYMDNLATVPVQTRLGCHFKCVYCTYRKIGGSEYSCFDPDEVVDTIRTLVRRGLVDIEIVDNVFNSPYDHAMAVCDAMVSSGIKARLQTVELNPLFIDDALIEGMGEAGFVGVGVTVESASDRVIARLRKGFAASDVRRAAEVVRRHGVPCLWIFMLGGPGETADTVMETLEFARETVRPRDAALFTAGIRIYPGTELEDIAREEGILSLNPAEMLEPVFYVSPEVEPGWMVNKIKEAMCEKMNFMDTGSLGLSYLPIINRLTRRLGVKAPLWRYTGPIRRALRLFGADA